MAHTKRLDPGQTTDLALQLSLNLAATISDLERKSHDRS